MTILLTFGSVFRYDEHEYVYLAQSDEIVYAAKILNQHYSDEVQALYRRRSKNPRIIGSLKNNTLYCYVELQTEQFKGRIAHLNKTEKDQSSFDPELIGLCLNKQDLQLLKEEILVGAVPLELKEKVRNLDVE